MGLERVGMIGDSVCEIDKNAQIVLRRHFPDTKLFDDVRKVGITTHEKKSIDLICGGFPCQDLSIAGKRQGLAGERSGLWFEFERIIGELEPKWVIIENVPGLLSSNKGKDIQIIIDTLTQMGYTCDIDIKDAQEFGVAQRRRRVFITCVRLDGLLNQRTDLSKQISVDLLSQILLNAWGATLQASSLVPLHSVYEKPIERCVNLLNKMTALLERTQERLACKKYQTDLDVLLDQFGVEGKNSEYGLIRKSEIQKGESSGKTVMYLSDLKAENGGTSISSWLKEYLVAVCEMEKTSTTSISKNQITDHQIYIFATMALLIIERMFLSTDWSENYWNSALSLSILLQENMNYARQASRNMFIESGLRHSWWNYLGSASNIQSELERRISRIRAAEVLFERESLQGNTPPSRKIGQDVAYSLRSNPSHSGDKGDGGINTNMVTGIIEQNNFASTPDMISLRSNPAQPVIFQQNTRDEVRLLGGDGQIAGALASQAGMKQQNYVMASGQANAEILEGQSPTLSLLHEQPILNGVRRLTPTECERLQGFPDGWTNGQSDSARYRQLGNAVAVPVVEWIGKRIMESNK